MYARWEKVLANFRNFGLSPRLDWLIESYLKGRAMENWETGLAETPLSCLGPAQAFTEPEISADQVEAVRAGLA